MPSYSSTSLNRLMQCHPKLVELMMEAVKHVDIGITCGHRNKADQDACFARGVSKLKFPASKHNALPSNAVDFVPFLDGKPAWNNKELVCNIAYFIKGIAVTKGINVRLGCDWNNSFTSSDEKFLDAFHIELV